MREYIRKIFCVSAASERQSNELENFSHSHSISSPPNVTAVTERSENERGLNTKFNYFYLKKRTFALAHCRQRRRRESVSIYINRQTAMIAMTFATFTSPILFNSFTHKKVSFEISKLDYIESSLAGCCTQFACNTKCKFAHLSLNH